MERIEAKGTGEIEVKRFYLPIVIKVPCAHCGHELKRDFSDFYLSYPSLNTPEEIGMCCEECEEETVVDVTLKLALEFDSTKARKL